MSFLGMITIGLLFDYRETFYTIGDGKVVVYEDGFRTDEVRMTYYRNPVRVDLVRYINAAGERCRTSTLSCPILWWRRFLDMVAKQFNLNENELQRYRFDKDNVASFR